MNYEITKDLELIKELLDLTQEQLADKIGFSVSELAKITAQLIKPNDAILEMLYSFSYGSGIRLNDIKEQLYKEEVTKQHVILFHGTKSHIDGHVSLDRSRATNDFGRGFYCGESYEQAASFINNFDKSSVYIVDFDLSGLNSYKYEVNQEWMLTIAYFRNKLSDYKKNKVIDGLLKKLENVDYLIAPIADNRMFDIIDSFINGEITDEQCKHCLAATNLGYQYVMLTDKAISQLTLLERCFLSSKEREDININKSNDQKTNEGKVKVARIKYRGKGKYIDEVLK